MAGTGWDWLGPAWPSLAQLESLVVTWGRLGPPRAAWGRSGRPALPCKLGLVQWFIPVLMTYQWFSSGLPVVYSSGLLACLWCLATARLIFKRCNF